MIDVLTLGFHAFDIYCLKSLTIYCYVGTTMILFVSL